MLEEYDNLKENNNDKLVFIKRGYFYYTYFRDSYIMSYIFNYKYIDGKVCFPITNKVCVCNRFNELNIGYVIDNDAIYGDSEVYNDYLAKGYNKVRIYYMSMINRYKFTKNIYSDYLVIIYRLGNYYSFSYDKEYLKYAYRVI